MPTLRLFTKLPLTVLLWLLAVLLAPTFAWADTSTTTQGYRYYSVGDLQAKRPGKTSQGLLLMGGGDWVDDAFRWFADKAGHGHIVILRASGADDLQQRWFSEIGGIVSAQTLVFDSREAASDRFVLDVLAKADGIFLAGGDQARYIRFWKGTPLNAALDRHVRDGKPLGGTSAGLAIQGGVSYGALDGGSITSREALQRPLDAALTLDSGFLHLPFLANVITDSHFTKRQRLGRLIGFLAKARQLELLGAPVGLGIDENTALCIDAAGEGRVFTDTGGYAWLVRPSAKAQAVSKDAALTLANVAITGIGSNSQLRLRDFMVSRPAFEGTADVSKGQLTVTSKPGSPAVPTSNAIPPPEEP